MTRAAPLAKKPAQSAREALALNLIRLRSKRGWSQEALAFEAGFHRTFIAHIEHQARNISLDNIERIARTFGLQAYQLLTPNVFDGAES